MSENRIYSFQCFPNGLVELYFNNSLVLTFSRSSFSEKCEAYAFNAGFSFNWIGFLLRLLDRSIPSPGSSPVRSDLDRLVFKLGTSGIADYLKSGGFPVSGRLDVPEGKDIPALPVGAACYRRF
jgi:hypothetical protein